MTEKPVAGVPMVLPPAVAEMVRVALQVCIKAMEEDEERLPASQACESISGILTNVGIAGLALTGDDGILLGNRLLQIILLTLQEKAPCQTALKVEQEEDADDDDHDVVIIDAVSDLIGVLAKVMGNSFVGHFDVLLPALMKYLRPGRVHSDRSMAIGCFAEVIEEIGESAVKYVDTVLPVIGCVDSKHRRCVATVFPSAAAMVVPTMHSSGWSTRVRHWWRGYRQCSLGSGQNDQGVCGCCAFGDGATCHDSCLALAFRWSGRAQHLRCVD